MIIVVFILQPELYIEEKYVFEKSWGTLDKSNLEFKLPSGVAVDNNETLYVSDTENNRIQKIQPDGNVTSIGNSGSNDGEFYSPTGIVVDSKGNVYVDDTFNHRIQKIQQPDGNVTAIEKEGSGDGVS